MTDYPVMTHVHTIQQSSLHPPFLTDYLEAAVLVDLSDVSGAEPPLAVAVYEEILLVLGVPLVVSHRDIGSTDQDLPSGMWLVSAAVAT